MATNKEREQLAAAMAQQEHEAALGAAGSPYTKTADGRLDRAISDYLTQSGYRYDIGTDAGYQDFKQQYSQNTLRGRQAAQATAEKLAGGWDPTYANAVGSEVQQDIGANVGNYIPAFHTLGQQEQAARAAQAGNTAQLLHSMDESDYQRGRDTQGDRMNYLNYLASRYQTERQAEQEQQGFANDVYRARLAADQEAEQGARNLENARYLRNTQSAESRAKLAADQNEFNQKMAYTAAKDAYDDRIAAQKAAAQQAAAQAKAEAQAQQQAQKDAAALEKQKAKYDKDSWKIQQVLAGKRKISGDMEYDLDYNGNHKIDNQDLVIASNAAKTGVVNIPAYGSDNAKAMVKKITNLIAREPISSRADIIATMVEKSDLDNQESLYVYQHFGIK